MTNKADEAGVKLVVDDSSDTIELHHAKDTLPVALSQLAITNLIQQKNMTADTSFKYLPYIFPFKNNFNQEGNSNTDLEQHKERLKDTLKSWSFILEPVCSDGNCFFTSIALNLIHNGKDLAFKQMNLLHY